MKDQITCSSKTSSNLLLPLVIFVLAIYFGYSTIQDLMKGVGSNSTNILFLLVYILIFADSVRLLLVYANRKIIVTKDKVIYTSPTKKTETLNWDEVKVYSLGDNRISFEWKDKRAIFSTKDAHYHDLVLFLRKNDRLTNN
ncbi:MAG: hypothetical protein SOS22_01680 [Absicoccus sp.]|uniref:PH domain-containing protein n=1 Tax=Absicoccus intestinalis TaxID=2926319 RepID=A0ABU4WQM7_9FIRM|nr:MULTISPECIES: hypothetical protein [unclassified Absicoccus]MDX8418361.1 hypothetical protein [Absicoccus sp. CLA-KB-P134]MDY3034915.1 hypothetical protein [Absicoccus sp.]